MALEGKPAGSERIDTEGQSTTVGCSGTTVLVKNVDDGAVYDHAGPGAGQDIPAEAAIDALGLKFSSNLARPAGWDRDELSTENKPNGPRCNVSNLKDIILHSPSTEIVGTPFDAGPSTRFEYPFPASPTGASVDVISSPLSAVSPTAMLSTSLPTSTPLTATSNPATRLSALPPPNLPHQPHSFPTIPSGSLAPGTTYSPTHPKLFPREPPEPPGLAIKRRRRLEMRDRSGSSGSDITSSSGSWTDRPQPPTPGSVSSSSSSGRESPDSPLDSSCGPREEAERTPLDPVHDVDSTDTVKMKNPVYDEVPAEKLEAVVEDTR